MIHSFAGRHCKSLQQGKKFQDEISSSGSSRISTAYMKQVVESLKSNTNRDSTSKNYLSIWRNFNQFIIRLDIKPLTWEERTTLFCGYLVHQNRKSATIRSYVSAIKHTLVNDGYEWDDKKVLLHSLTRACKLKNDIIQARFPIGCKLLELILFEVNRIFHQQTYLRILYKNILIIGYYGMLRIGELTQSEHVILAKDVHLALNKKKLLIVLYSSKTHGKESLPQKIKISGLDSYETTTGGKIHLQHHSNQRCFCPFLLTSQYIKLRGEYESENEQFFVFADKSPVCATHVRKVLKDCIKNLNLNEKLYDCHSLRAGRATDMLKYQFSVDEIKKAGRWKSNAVFKYLKG